MARSPKEVLDTFVSWPECGGFQADKLAEIIAELEERIEELEARAARAAPKKEDEHA